jgi:GNAT superfamily N-acetyltransferase
MDSSDNGMELVVRPIEARDAADVFLLTEQLGYERPREAILEWIERVASDTMSQGAYVACLGDEVVGWIEVSLERRLQTAPFALIGGLVVKEGFRGRAIGRRLCEAAESWSWERGVEAVRVTSRDTRADAHRFYLRDGYRLVKTSLVFEKKRPG